MTRGGALNVVLPLARGDLLVVFDAEDVPDPQQLRHAAAAFARLSARTACLQGRLVVVNHEAGLLARCFAVEYASLFDVLGPALARWRLPYPLGGTSTHFRIGPLRALHGWDAWNVTEDADLGIRLALAGYHVGDLPSETREEGLWQLRPFVRQRSRWMKGFMQTAIVHARPAGGVAGPRAAGLPRRHRPDLRHGGLSAVLPAPDALRALAALGHAGPSQRSPLRQRSTGAGAGADRRGARRDDRARARGLRPAGLVAPHTPLPRHAGVLPRGERGRMGRPLQPDPRTLVLGQDRARPRAAPPPHSARASSRAAASGGCWRLSEATKRFRASMT